MSNQTQIKSASPPCPKCKSYLFMTRFIDGVYYLRCKNCGYQKHKDKVNWYKVVMRYLERFMFWK